MSLGQPRSHQQVLGSRRQWILASRTGPGGGKSRNSAKKRDFHNKVTWTDPDQTGNSLDLFQPGQLIRESIFTCTSCSLEFTCTEIQLQNPLVVLSKNELASLEAFLKL